MLFNSYIFIFLFLPLALLGWYGLNRCRAYEMAKLFLAVMSLWFYGYFNLYYLFVILGSILVNYLLSFLLKRFSSPEGMQGRTLGRCTLKSGYFVLL